MDIRALVGWARNSGSCPAQVHSLCFSMKQSDPQTRGTNGTACVRNGDSPALSVSPGAHSSRKATMNILNPFKASAPRSHRVHPSSRCVSDREMLWMRQRSESHSPRGKVPSTPREYNWKMSYVWKLLSKSNLWCETLCIYSTFKTTEDYFLRNLN